MHVVSLAPSATEIAFALGCGDQLIARTAFCDYPLEARRVPALGGWTTADVASVIALKPDLVLTSTFLQDGIAAELRAHGCTVCHTDPRTLPDVLESFRATATALGVAERGETLRTQVASALRSLTTGHGLAAPTVYAEEWHHPPMASGNWVPELIAAAGGRSFLPPGERSRPVRLDEIQQFDPDMVILNYCGMERIPPDAQAAQFQSREGWRELRAVQARRVMVLPDSLLNRPGPRLVAGAQAIHQALVAAYAVTL